MLSLLVLVGSEWFLNQKPITAPYGTLVKLVKTPAFHAGDDGFEPHRYHQYPQMWIKLTASLTGVLECT